MIRFGAGVFWRVFHEEIALVLHHASVWGEITGVVVDVNSGADRTHGLNSLHAWDFAVDLDTAGDRAAHLAQLHGYLARILPPEYDVVLEADHVHVECDRRRKPAPIATGFRSAAPTTS